MIAQRTLYHYLIIGLFGFFLIQPLHLSAETPPFDSYVQEIETRLDQAFVLYQAKKETQARQMVQMAYFELFENLEGAIRINFSAQKSYQMEATFGEIRKMMKAGATQEEILIKVNQLKADLQEVLPALKTGHQLQAENAHDVYDNHQIAPYWQTSFRVIDDNLANMISSYQEGKFNEAKHFAQQAQYEGYKNSEMEMSIRLNRSAKISGKINQQFYDLIKLSEKAGSLTILAYQTTQLLQDIEALLPNLPASREEAITVQDLPADQENNWQSVYEKINIQLQQAVQRYQSGEREQAILDVQDTYFDVFEASGFEAKIGSRDSQFKAQLEGYFTRLVGLMKANSSEAILQSQVSGLAENMAKAVEMLQGSTQNEWSLFLYSLLIIVREGLEALLIVAAIVTYLVKNHHQDKLPVIRQSVFVALGASVVTAGVFQLIFENSGANRELLEGFTMMLAVIMLFMMSYWLLSKVEARNWKRYLEGKLSNALTTGSLIGLWLTSFLAVYREGAETVLFYYALIADAQTTIGLLYLGAGFVVGVIILAVCYVIMRYSIVKLPLKPFFMFTGSFMYLMAFVFAGKSVLELIEGKLFQPTLLANMFEIPWLGIYPYVETLIPQVLLILAGVFALFYMKRQAR